MKKDSRRNFFERNENVILKASIEDTGISKTFLPFLIYLCDYKTQNKLRNKMFSCLNIHDPILIIAEKENTRTLFGIASSS